jgi:hypothetical protein
MTVSAGGIIYASDMNRALRGGPERPLCILRRTTMPFSVANNGVVVPWDVETEDTHGWHSTSVNTSRITPNVAGWIELSGALSWANTSATGRRATAFRFNGATTYYGDIIVGTTVGNTGTTHNLELEFNGSTDYVELFAYQNSGGAYDVADATSSFFSAKWVRES